MEYSCDVCEGVSNRNLDMLDKLQKWICSKNVGLHLLFFLSRRLIVGKYSIYVFSSGIYNIGRRGLSEIYFGRQ